MKYQNLFSEKNKKNISICHLLKILPRVLSINNKFKHAIILGKIKKKMHNSKLKELGCPLTEAKITSSHFYEQTQ